MSDLSLTRFQRTLAETIAWFKLKELPTAVESGEIRLRQESYSVAEKNWNSAIEIMHRRGLPSVHGIEQFERAIASIRNNQNHLGPMAPYLRSPELKPRFCLDQFGDDTLWAEAVEEVVSKRAAAVNGFLNDHPAIDVGGRFLLYTPSENLACGAADASSNGFFDSNNVPPWDSWLGFSNGTLVSWIPPSLVDVAAMGVFVNPEECIRWAAPHQYR